MMTIRAMSTATLNDAELVGESLSGNRDAFGQIVSRYQSLVCSLAYSATGSLSQSEDLAQETFVAAWRQLADLREPGKLRAWLCGIARNLINNTLRRQVREPAHAAEQLEAAPESPSVEPSPTEQAISREEEAILWRSLERIPEIYREPLVLFYREHQSIEAVAQNLELTEDAVKQRLSRGRKLLHEQVLAFVEGALARTNPGQAFTLGVLAALPVFVTSTKAATLGAAAAKGGATATGATFASVLGVLLGPVIGLLGGYFGVRNLINSTRTPRERAFVTRYLWIVMAAVVVFIPTLLLFTSMGLPLWKRHPVLFITSEFAITAAYGAFIFVSSWRFNRAFARIRGEEQRLHPDLFRAEPLPTMWNVWEYRSRATLFGLPLVHCRSVRLPGQKLQPAVGWIASGELAYGILFASGVCAVGGISMGAVSVGVISIGGLGIGLLAFGGLALGGVALGGAAIGIIASGGIAVGWHAATGGVAAAHEIALGGAALAHHANDAVARDFLARHRWLDFSQTTPRNVFYTICFSPMFLMLMIGCWRRRITAKRAKQN
jgi:RNA polymerase sigma factor (sigma-70 family)